MRSDGSRLRSVEYLIPSDRLLERVAPGASPTWGSRSLLPRLACLASSLDLVWLVVVVIPFSLGPAKMTAAN